MNNFKTIQISKSCWKKKPKENNISKWEAWLQIKQKHVLTPEDSHCHHPHTGGLLCGYDDTHQQLTISKTFLTPNCHPWRKWNHSKLSKFCRFQQPNNFTPLDPLLTYSTPSDASHGFCKPCSTPKASRVISNTSGGLRMTGNLKDLVSLGCLVRAQVEVFGEFG